VLSKGHAALALYAALFLKGYITEDRLNTFCADGSSLGVHPEIVLEWVDFATGSLGHGLSYGVGAALAARLQKSSRRTFVLISDAECNEGAVWEALMFAGHHRLANLTVIVDINGQQAMGYTREVLDLAPLAEKFRAFGWDAHEIDGHNVSEILQALQSLEYSQGAPHVILARTTFGKGVSFMENQIRWHYLPLTDELFQRAMAEVDSL
jgi:transketolase